MIYLHDTKLYNLMVIMKFFYFTEYSCKLCTCEFIINIMNIRYVLDATMWKFGLYLHTCMIDCLD